MAPAIAERYRADIDGLRAVAVLSVVLFHAKVPGFSGGFVGVDVFFVISGFLITGIISREIAAGTFSFAAFYERRIRRIAPALAVMCLCLTVAVGFWMVPGDLIDYARALLSTTFFYANFYFLGQTDYFAPAAEAQPLLHTWSLAVEEQFYLVFPPLLMLLTRLGQRRLIIVVAALAFASLIAAELVVRNAPELAFFLPFTRAWELLIGALIALCPLPKPRSALVAEGVTAAGLAMIVGVAVLYGPDTRFPGLSALLPCIGAALIIQGGLWQTTKAGNLLSLAPVVYVGRCSYAFYLWHWPVLALWTYLNGPAPLETRLTLVAAAFVLSVVSYYVIEQPMRQRQVVPTPKLLFGAYAASGVVFAALATASLVTRGLPARLPAPLLADLAVSERPIFNAPCVADKRYAKLDCRVIGAAGAPATADLIGDSHAKRFAALIGKGWDGTPNVLDAFTTGGCAPMLPQDVEDPRLSKSCRPLYRLLAERVRSGKLAPHVILVGYWSSYLQPEKRTRYARDLDEHRRIFSSMVTNLVDTLLAQGRHVTLVGPLPDSEIDVHRSALLAFLRGRIASHGIPRAVFDERQRYALELMAELSRKQNVTVVYPHRILCDAVRCLTANERGTPIYFDDNHLNYAGIALLSPLLGEIFGADAAGRQPHESSKSF